MKKSAAPVKIPHTGPTSLYTLVAPGFFVPLFFISIFFILAKILALDIEPKKYVIRIKNAILI